MLQSFFETICRVGIFMICAQAIVHFRAQEEYEKYLKLLVSVMILIQLFWPVGRIFFRGSGQGAMDGLGRLREQMEQSLRDAEENGAAADEILGRMTLEEVRGFLEAQKAEAADGQEGEGGTEDGAGGQSGEDGMGKGADGQAWEIGIDEIEVEMETVEPITLD